MNTPIALLSALVSISFTGALAYGQAVVEVEINHSAAENDDYIGWAPVAARAKLISGGSDQNVKLTSTKRSAGGSEGEVAFAAFTASRPTPATFSESDSLDLTLPSSGAWKSFWVAGKEASSDGKDVRILVKDAASGGDLGEHPLMVRVRKNAESLTPGEINRFLEALAALHDLDNAGADSKYVKYPHVHSRAFFMGIHQGASAFSPWHRTVLLSLERELQAIDPRVAVPYWKFDDDAPTLFSRDFIGTAPLTGPSPFNVEFSPTNPLRGWVMPPNAAVDAMVAGNSPPISNQPLRRTGNGGASHPPVALNTVLNAAQYGAMNPLLEDVYHNDAHNHVGGWMGSAQSPKDPLFFLLHANVDRAWAQWQKNKNAFNSQNNTDFSPQGSFPGTTAAQHQGSYVEDSQWPWNNGGGNQGTATSQDDWPAFVFTLIASPANHGPSEPPIVKETVDYLDVQGDGFPLGYCYDTIKWD